MCVCVCVCASLCIIMLVHLSISLKKKKMDNIFHLDVHYVCMLVQHFVSQGRRFTDFHYYYHIYKIIIFYCTPLYTQSPKLSMTKRSKENPANVHEGPKENNESLNHTISR